MAPSPDPVAGPALDRRISELLGIPYKDGLHSWSQSSDDAFQLLLYLHKRWQGKVRITIRIEEESSTCDFVATTGHGRLALAAHEDLPMAICLALLKIRDGWV